MLTRRAAVLVVVLWLEISRGTLDLGNLADGTPCKNPKDVAFVEFADAAVRHSKYAHHMSHHMSHHIIHAHVLMYLWFHAHIHSTTR